MRLVSACWDFQSDSRYVVRSRNIMAALVDGQYALSSHFSTSADKTVVHVKLTDAAFKAFEEFQKIKDATSRRAKIEFKDNHGMIKVPIKKSSDNPEGIRQFQLTLSSIQTDPNGSFECIWQQQRDRRRLVTLGSMSHKISVHATDDVYQTTREKMNKAEVESKKLCAKEIKPSGPHISRKIKRVVKGGDATVAGRSSSVPNKVLGSGSHHQNGAIQNKPINTPHKPHNLPAQNKSTPSSSHQRPSHSPHSVSSHNSGSRQSPHAPSGPNPSVPRQSPHPPSGLIGRSSPNPAVYNLPYRDRIIHLLALRPYKKPELMGRLQKDGIKDRDKNALSGLLQQVAVFSAKDNSYTLLKHLYNEVRPDFPGYTETDRQLLKRRMPPPSGDVGQSAGSSPAISPAHSHSSTGSSPGGSQKRPTSTTEEDALQPLMKKPRISHERQKEMRQETNRQVKLNDSQNQKSPSPPPVSLKKLSPNNSPVEVSTTTPDTALVPKEYLKTQNNNNEKPRRNSTAKVPASSTSEMPDYLIHYQVIQYPDQRQKYKLDFNAEYEEYLTKHSYIDKVTKRFKQLEMSLRKQEEGSEDYENVKNQILNEYRMVRKDPNYIEHRKRCDYLHKKLGHIKKLILEYDQAQLMNS